MEKNAITFGCPDCKVEMQVKWLVIQDDKFYLVGVHSCGIQVNFELDKMIAGLLNAVLIPESGRKDN